MEKAMLVYVLAILKPLQEFTFTEDAMPKWLTKLNAVKCELVEETG
jgi:hypothetical protein